MWQKATEEHCATSRHRKRILYALTCMPTQQEMGHMHGNWGQDVDAWGLDPGCVQKHFGGPSPAILPPRVFQFAFPQQPPTFQATTAFWGDRIFTGMRCIMRELLTEGSPRGLWYFDVPEIQWYECVVYSDCSIPQTQDVLRNTDPGMWWPC